MPKEWSEILCIKFEGDTVFNLDHSIAKLVDRTELAEFLQRTHHLSPQDKMMSACKGSRKIKAMALLCLADLTTDQWQGLHDFDPKAFADLFESTSLECSDWELRILCADYQMGLRIVSKGGASFTENTSWSPNSWQSYEGRLPKPEDKWWIK
jgi:hypothetical protein